MKRISSIFCSLLLVFIISIGFVGQTFGSTKLIKSFDLKGKWVEDIKINLLPSVSTIGNRGYFEQRFMISNKSSKEKNVQLKLKNYSAMNEGSNFYKKVIVPPESTVVASLYVNSPFMALLRLKVYIDGEEFDGRTDFKIHTSINSTQNPVFLVSGKVKGDLSKYPFTDKGSYSNDFVSTRLNYSVESLSDNWLAYSCFDALIFTEEEYKSLSKEIADAIKSYVEVGGYLVIETKNVPRNVKKSSYFNNISEEKVVYGKIFYTSKPFSELSEHDASRLLRVFTKKRCSAINKTNFPVLMNNPIRNSVLISLIIIFAILAGPVGLIYLSLKKRKILLIWITPVLAIIFSFIIIIYSITAEGLFSRVRIINFTHLDENSQKASTLAVHGYYCPIPPGALYYDNNCEVILARKVDGFYGNNDLSRHSIDWTGEQLLTNGWINPRIESYLRIRKSEFRRERLSIVKQNKDTLEIINGLGADLEKLCVKTQDGRIYYTNEKINAGAKAILKYDQKALISKKVIVPQSSFDYIMNVNVKNKNFADLAVGRFKYLQNGSYVGVFSKSPFLKMGLREGFFSVEAHQENFIYGILKSSKGAK